MRNRYTAAIVLAISLVAGLLAAPSATAAANRFDMSDPQTYIIKTSHGYIYAEAIHPVDNGKIVTAPAILTISPYSNATGRNADAADWVPNGYVRITADVLGTGNSGGCFDLGGKRDKEVGYDLVEWVAKQKWSTSKVGMIGGAYEGSAAIAAALMNPPHLATIVPELPVTSQYDYSFSGGLRYLNGNEALGREGVGNGLLSPQAGMFAPANFDLGYAVPPPVDVQGANWADRVSSSVSPCDELDHLTAAYSSETPEYNGFWAERDYVADASKIKVPTLVAGSWGDWDIKADHAYDLFKSLKNSKKASLYMGSRWNGHSLPDGKYTKVRKQWMDYYLKGIKIGANKLAPITSQGANSQGATKWTSGKPKAKPISLMAQQLSPGAFDSPYPWFLFDQKPDKDVWEFQGGAEAVGFPSGGANAETHAAHHSRSNHDWYFFQSPPLKKDLRIFGEIKVQHYSEVDRKWVTLTPTVLDIDHSKMIMPANQHVASCDPAQGSSPEDCTNPIVGVTRGFLDSRYSDGWIKSTTITPGQPFKMSVQAKPIDYTFSAGHAIALNIQTEIVEWALSNPYPGCENPSSTCTTFKINWVEGKTRVILPVVGGPDQTYELWDAEGHGDHG